MTAEVCSVCKKPAKRRVQQVPLCRECHTWLCAHPARSWIFRSRKRVRNQVDRMWVDLHANLICAAFGKRR